MKSQPAVALVDPNIELQKLSSISTSTYAGSRVRVAGRDGSRASQHNRSNLDDSNSKELKNNQRRSAKKPKIKRNRQLNISSGGGQDSQSEQDSPAKTSFAPR